MPCRRRTSGSIGRDEVLSQGRAALGAPMIRQPLNFTRFAGIDLSLVVAFENMGAII